MAQHIGDSGIATLVAALAKLPKKPAASQARIRRRPFAQIWDEWIDQPLTRLARAINRSLKATLDAFANGLAIETELAGDR